MQSLLNYIPLANQEAGETGGWEVWPSSACGGAVWGLWLLGDIEEWSGLILNGPHHPFLGVDTRTVIYLLAIISHPYSHGIIETLWKPSISSIW